MPTQMPKNGAPRCKHVFVQRLHHAVDVVEPAPAIGEGADARQHHARCARHLVGIAGDDDRPDCDRCRAPRARRPWPPSASCRSRNRRWRRSWRAPRLGEEADDVGARSAFRAAPASVMPAPPAAALQRPACASPIRHRNAVRRLRDRRRPRSRASSSGAVQLPAPQACRLPARPAARSASRQSTFAVAGTPKNVSAPSTAIMTTT